MNKSDVSSGETEALACDVNRLASYGRERRRRHSELGPSEPNANAPSVYTTPVGQF